MSRPHLPFAVAFGGLALLLALALEWAGEPLAHGYQQGMAQAAGSLLRVAGVPAAVSAGADGIGVIVMPRAIFHVTGECTGLHAVALFVAAVLAWPAPLAYRLRGLAWGLPAFFLYSAVRIGLLGLAAHLAPAWTQFLHVYLLVLVNAGVLLCLWALWVNGAPSAPRRELA